MPGSRIKRSVSVDDVRQANMSKERRKLARIAVRPNAAVERPIAAEALNLSGMHVITGFAITIATAGPLLWAFVRYWLFAP